MKTKILLIVVLLFSITISQAGMISTALEVNTCKKISTGKYSKSSGWKDTPECQMQKQIALLSKEVKDLKKLIEELNRHIRNKH